MKTMTAIFASPGSRCRIGAWRNRSGRSTTDQPGLRDASQLLGASCWDVLDRGVGYDLNGLNGYWSACTNTSANQSANNARAQAQPPQREHTGRH
jgi:hypothetical protein